MVYMPAHPLLINSTAAGVHLNEGSQLAVLHRERTGRGPSVWESFTVRAGGAYYCLIGWTDKKSL